MLWGVPFSSGIGYRKGQGRRQVKQSGVDSMGGVWGGVSPPKLEDSVWGYNLKLISTLHNDSIPQTPSGKSGVTCPRQPTPWQRPWEGAACAPPDKILGVLPLEIVHSGAVFILFRLTRGAAGWGGLKPKDRGLSPLRFCPFTLTTAVVAAETARPVEVFRSRRGRWSVGSSGVGGAVAGTSAGAAGSIGR